MSRLEGFVFHISIPEPSLNNNVADAQRLESVLEKATGGRHIQIPLTLLKKLPVNLRQWQYQAKAVLFKNLAGWILVDLVAPDSPGRLMGAAVDIGTTRVVVGLIDLETGEDIADMGFDNPQAKIGPDVLTRIHHSNKPGGLEELSSLVIDGVNQCLENLCSARGLNVRDIRLMAGAGNTAMTHLFLGIHAFEIIKEPYIPCVNIPDTVSAEALGLHIHERGQVFLFPNIGSYFGGDLIAGILCGGIDEKHSPCLMVDVGTNAEIVVGSRDWLIACAGAAGPALEGGVSKMGMTAGPGVIDRVWIDDQTGKLQVHTIEQAPAKGICGSGMIDLAAALFLSGRVDIRGKFVPDLCGEQLFTLDGIAYFILVDKAFSGTGEHITLSQVDMNSLTSSKAAMYTILEVIVKNTAGLEFEALEKFYVAGTFGSFIDPVSAISIGMLPDIPLETFEVLGNTSLGGAKMLLKKAGAYERVMQIRQSITYIELNVNQEFMNMFSGAKFYPHTDKARFPSLEGKIQV